MVNFGSNSHTAATTCRRLFRSVKAYKDLISQAEKQIEPVLKAYAERKKQVQAVSRRAKQLNFVLTRHDVSLEPPLPVTGSVAAVATGPDRSRCFIRIFVACSV